MDKIISNAILLAMMLDGLLFLFVRSWQVHKLKYETTALTDKLYYSSIITLSIKALVYLGGLIGINTPLFILVSYLGDVGFFVIACVLGLIAHSIFKTAQKTA